MNMPSISFGLPEGIEYDQINKVYSVCLPETGKLVTYAYLGAIGLGCSRVSSDAPITVLPSVPFGCAMPCVST